MAESGLPQTSLFEQGKAFEDLGEKTAALRLYAKAIDTKSPIEEMYCSLWRVGVLTGRTEDLLMASVYRPCRLEALVHLCGLLRGRGEWATIYVVARYKRGIGNLDSLLVDKTCEWRIVEEHGIAAMNLGCKEEAISDFRFVLDHYDLEPADRDRVAGYLQEAKDLVLPC